MARPLSLLLLSVAFSGSSAIVLSPPCGRLLPPSALRRSGSTLISPHRVASIALAADEAVDTSKEFPTAIATLRWRSSQLVARVLALPLQLLTAMLGIAGSAILFVAHLMRKLHTPVCSVAEFLANVLFRLVSAPTMLLSIGLGAVGRVISQAASRTEGVARRLTQQPGTISPAGSADVTSLSTWGRFRRRALDVQGKKKDVESGRQLARKQMYERAELALPTKPARFKAAAAAPPAATGMSAEQIAELRAKQAPVRYSISDSKYAVDKRVPQQTSPPRTPTTATPSPPPAATPASAPAAAAAAATAPAEGTIPKEATADTSSSAPKTVGEAKAALRGGGGGAKDTNSAPVVTVGDAKGSNKWLWRGATTPVPSAKADETAETEDA